MTTYKIFEVEPFGPTEQAVIITTAQRNAGGYPRGEWFLLLPDGETVIGQAVRFHYKEFPEGLPKLDDEFMHHEMLDEVRLRLRKYMGETAGIISSVANRWSLALKLTNADLFVHRWTRGFGIEQLRRVFHATASEELKAAIQAISALEQYDRRDL